MDKIAFAKLVTFVTHVAGIQLLPGQIDDLNSLTNNTHTPSPELVHDLMHALASNRKIEAIKAHRSLTGVGLRESKDAVEEVTDRFNHGPAQWDNH